MKEYADLYAKKALDKAVANAPGIMVSSEGEQFIAARFLKAVQLPKHF